MNAEGVGRERPGGRGALVVEGAPALVAVRVALADIVAQETRDGRLLDGLIVNETSNSLTLRRPEAEDLTLLKAAIADVRASSVSLMPDGFADGIDPRQMADLIAYLQGDNLQ